MSVVKNMYNNIFASAYLAYEKKEKRPKDRASTFVFMHFALALSVLFYSLKAIYPPPFKVLTNNANFGYFFFGIWISLLFLTQFYYKESRVKAIVENFKRNALKERRFWGYFTVISFIAEILLIIILPWFFR